MGISIPYVSADIAFNYSYFPIRVGENYGMSRNNLYDLLRKFDIYSRKYFYPLISNFSMYKNLPSAARINLPIANKISSEILCLPIYPSLSLSEVDMVCDLIENK